MGPMLVYLSVKNTVFGLRPMMKVRASSQYSRPLMRRLLLFLMEGPRTPSQEFRSLTLCLSESRPPGQKTLSLTRPDPSKGTHEKVSHVLTIRDL